MFNALQYACIFLSSGKLPEQEVKLKVKPMNRAPTGPGMHTGVGGTVR